MRVLVVYCHPKPDSFAAAMRDAVVDGLNQAGHEPQIVDLYAEDFDPRFGAHEHAAYENPNENGQGLERYTDQLRWADGLVFVFPTWWYDMPAMLKGWLDRVWLPGVAFAPAAVAYTPLTLPTILSLLVSFGGRSLSKKHI